MNSAGCPAASIRAESATRQVTPVEVSLCTTQTALIAARGPRQGASTASGSTPWRQSPGSSSIRARAAWPWRTRGFAKCPVSNISTRSPGESVLTRAASQAPVPEAG